MEAGIIAADHVGKFVEFATSRGIPLGEALVELGVCDQKAVNEALLSMGARIRIGELLVERKLVTPADLKRASDEQKSDKRS